MKKKPKLQIKSAAKPIPPSSSTPSTELTNNSALATAFSLTSKNASPLLQIPLLTEHVDYSSASPQTKRDNISLPTKIATKTPKYRVHMKDFELLKVLGTGAYGKVFLVRKLNGHDKGKLYAMKVLRKEVVAQKTKTLDHTRTERKVLESVRNEPFLVTMHYAFQTKTKLHLILDYVNGGELFTHLYQRDHFREDDVKIYIGELILALEKLHKVSNESVHQAFN